MSIYQGTFESTRVFSGSSAVSLKISTKQGLNHALIIFKYSAMVLKVRDIGEIAEVPRSLKGFIDNYVIPSSFTSKPVKTVQVEDGKSTFFALSLKFFMTYICLLSRPCLCWTKRSGLFEPVQPIIEHFRL